MLEEPTFEFGSAGIYVHVPFCLRKCLYCDFVSYPAVPDEMNAYFKALVREIQIVADQLSQVSVTSAYLGGGTPSALPTAMLCGILSHIRAAFNLDSHAEISAEINPGTLEAVDLAAVAAAGVNRLSIGVQSLDDGLLQRLGRVHTAGEAVDSIRAARAAGFQNINIDLMFGLPGQSLSDLRQTVDRVIELAPEHISCYSLIVEPTTPLAKQLEKRELELPDEDLELAMYEWVMARLHAAGYEHYEISSWARPGYRSRHNELYWRNEWYRGLGPAAHSHWDRQRWANAPTVKAYSQALDQGVLPVVERCQLSADDEMDETMIMGLRLLEGVSEERFRTRYGRGLEATYGPEIVRLVRLGLVEYGSSLRLTRKGLLIANQVFAAFLRSP
ncbi:MAG: radical SAM family heme chaperone HemW [Limnochordia bacterium]|jgi:oxygen-independent coproporphyrinogen-3 oxidase